MDSAMSLHKKEEQSNGAGLSYISFGNSCGCLNCEKAKMVLSVRQR